MVESLFSPVWYRVADLRPQLAGGVVARRQEQRGGGWHLLVSTVSNRQFRVNPRAWQFVGRCDGRRSVESIWDALLEDLGDAAPTQDEIVRLLAQLAEAGLIDSGSQQDMAAQSERRALRQRQKNGFPNPLAFRIRLGDPSRFLQPLEGLGRAIFNPPTLACWSLLVLLACLLAASHWDEIAGHAVIHMSTQRYLMLAWLAFPVVKAVHELGHALAVRRWGGVVTEAGIGLFVLTPAPYVDASASAVFRKRGQRIVVAAAGIMVELFLAALALVVWQNVGDGWVRDTAFVVMVICGVSTLAFNANPLMQFDGYHILCEAIDLPGLAGRSRRYWMTVLRSLMLGREGGASMEVLPGERIWLVAYAPSAWIYRCVVTCAVVLWVGSWSATLGAMVALYAGVALLALPLVALVRDLGSQASSRTRLRRARLGLAAAALALVLGLCVLPLPFHTVASGVVWLPEHARARPETDGFVAAFTARDGQAVRPGDLLARLEDPALLAKRTALRAQLDSLRADRFEALQRDPLKVTNIDEDMRRVEAELARTEERIALLEVRSGAAGQLVMPGQEDLLGTHVKRGATLGYVLDRREIGVRVAVPEQDALLIRQRPGAVEVRLSEAAPEVLAAGLVREIPAAVHELPSPALGDRGGGAFVTDPADKEGLRSLEPVVMVDLALPGRMLERVGGRVWVRFDHGYEPLSGQVYRRARQLFIKHFDPRG